MTDYKMFSDLLGTALKLNHPPLAVCFADSVPTGVPHFSQHAPAGCRFWQEAMKSTFATSSQDHAACSIGVYTHNLEPTPAQPADLTESLKAFADLGYVREQDLPLIPVLESRSRYVIYAPLSETPLPPDVVLLFVNANQSLILSEATQQVENQIPLAMGRPACAVIPQARNSGRAALSLGCCGARAYLDTLTENIAVFAIPGEKLAAYSERIDGLAKANDILSAFHGIRRRDIEAGKTPSVKESLSALKAGG